MSRPIALLSALGCGFALYERSYWSAVGLALITYVASQSIRTAPPARLPRKLTRSASAPANLGREKPHSAQPVLLPPPLTSRLLWVEEATSPPKSSLGPLVRLDSLPRLKLNWLSSFGNKSPIIDLRSSPPLQIDWDGSLGISPLSLEIGDVWGPTNLPVQLFMTSQPLLARWAAEHKLGKPLVFLVGNDYKNFFLNSRFERIFVQISEKGTLFSDGSMVGTSPILPGRIESFARVLEPGGELRFTCITPNLTFLERLKERLAGMESIQRLFLLPPQEEKVFGVRIEQKGMWSEAFAADDYTHLIYKRAE